MIPAPRLAVLALALAATLGLTACERKPADPPTPKATRIDSPVNAQPRPVDLRLLT
jgi:hypothetical protein